MVMSDQSDWLLCPGCSASAARYLGGRSAPAATAATSQASAAGASTRVSVTPPPTYTHDLPAKPFSTGRQRLAHARSHAFDKPGPLYNEARKGVMNLWFDGADRNLADAQRALEHGTDVNGTPMSRKELAESVERMCSEYEKVLTRVGEVCGSDVQGEVRDAIGSIRADRTQIIAAREPAAGPPTQVSEPSPQAQPKDAAPHSADPSKVSADLAKLLAELCAHTIIPPSVQEVMRALDKKAERALKSGQTWAAVSLVLSLVVALAVGGGADSFWVGVLAFVAGIAIAWLVQRVASRVYLRLAVDAVSRQRAVAREDGRDLFKQLREERALFGQIKQAATHLGTQQLSADLINRISEAIRVALIQVNYASILTPTRDVAAKREQLKPLKELADEPPKVKTPVVSTCTMLTRCAEKVLDNRERLFATVDRMAARQAQQGTAGL